MRLFISGSAPLLEETHNQFENITGHKILERYGMSETNMNASNPYLGERKPGTVGLPLEGQQVRIVDNDDKPVGEDEIGKIQVKGPNVFKGYWKLAQKYKEDFSSDDYFNTGDQGTRKLSYSPINGARLFIGWRSKALAAASSCPRRGILRSRRCFCLKR